MSYRILKLKQMYWQMLFIDNTFHQLDLSNNIKELKQIASEKAITLSDYEVVVYRSKIKLDWDVSHSTKPDSQRLFLPPKPIDANGNKNTHHKKD